MIRAITGAVCVVAVSACATTMTRLDGTACSNPYDCNSEASFEAAVEIRDDRMEPYIRYDTDRTRGPYYPGTIFGGIEHDFSFVVLVDRATGSHTVMLRGYMENDRDWASPSSVYFPDLNERILLEQGRFDAYCSARTCDHLENFYATMDKGFISRFLAYYSEPYSTAEVRFNSRIDVDRTIRASELRSVLKVAGVLGQY